MVGPTASCGGARTRLRISRVCELSAGSRTARVDRECADYITVRPRRLHGRRALETTTKTATSVRVVHPSFDVPVDCGHVGSARRPRAHPPTHAIVLITVTSRRSHELHADVAGSPSGIDVGASPPGRSSRASSLPLRLRRDGLYQDRRHRGRARVRSARSVRPRQFALAGFSPRSARYFSRPGGVEARAPAPRKGLVSLSTSTLRSPRKDTDCASSSATVQSS